MASSEPVNFIDIHSHILPGVDDGARDLDESLLILKEAVDSGVKEITLTPHFPYNGVELNKITHQFDSFREIVSQRGVDITLNCGTELMLCPELPELIKDDKRLTINGKGKYALIEMPFFELPMYAPSVFFSLLAHGVTPIWAHPERCQEVINDFSVTRILVENGVLLQINAGSLIGMYGKAVKNAASQLTQEGLVSILASDAHRPGQYDIMPKAYMYLEKVAGKEKAVDMTFLAPYRIISSRWDK